MRRFIVAMATNQNTSMIVRAFADKGEALKWMYGQIKNYESSFDEYHSALHQVGNMIDGAELVSGDIRYWWTVSSVFIPQNGDKAEYTYDELESMILTAIRKERHFTEEGGELVSVYSPPPFHDFEISEIVEILLWEGGPNEYLNHILDEEYDSAIDSEMRRLIEIAGSVIGGKYCSEGPLDNFGKDVVEKYVNILIPKEDYEAQKINLSELLKALEDEVGLTWDAVAKLPCIRKSVKSFEGSTATLGEIIATVELDLMKEGLL